MKIKQLKILVILLAIVLTFQLSESEAKVKTFIKKVNGGGYVLDAIQTTNGNYISVSRVSRATFIVSKITPLGKRIWERSFSVRVASDGYWRLESIAQTNEGYVLVGWARDSEDDIDEAMVVALRFDGTVSWTKRFGLTASFGAHGFIEFRSVTSTPDGGFIASGWGYWEDDDSSRPIVVKFAPGGDIQWQKVFLSLDGRFLAQSTSDNGLVLAAQLSDGGADIVKLDDTGNIIWKRSLTIEDFHLEAIGYDPNLGVVLAGTSTDSILFLIGLDSNGKIVWRANYSVDPPFLISRIVPTVDGGYVVAGTIKSGAGVLLKIDAKKHLVFHRTFGVPGIESIFALSEGGFIAFGSNTLLRLNSDGIVPDCPYFQNLNSKAVSKRAIKVGSSSVSSQSVTLRTPTVFDLTSKRLRHSVSTICSSIEP